MNDIVFYPKFSIWAYVFLIGIEIFFFILFLIIIFPIFKYPNPKALIPTAIGATVVVITMIIFGNLILIYRTMRYEFKDDALHLICGKYHDIIKYEDILKWEKKNLVFNPLASKRFPGFSIGDVYYSDEGRVRMYATSAGKNVLLLRTKSGIKYGITPNPDDEEKFIKELEKRVKK
ncbi:MAG: hypothetical protein H5U37_04260 [Caldisericia bacterium]|nr:hypothetical protein [Caldisericia bacterium]